MRLPYATELPAPLRAVGRALLPAPARARVAAELQHLAHLRDRFHPLSRASRAHLARLKGSHAGQACIIIGNGPSLAQHDVADLARLPTFCLNRGYLKWSGSGHQPTYAVAVNDLVIQQFASDLGALECPIFVPWQYHGLFAAASNATFMELRWKRKFYADVTSGLWPGATVTFAALQLAYHMGFRTAILIGVDHHFKQAGEPHKEVVQSSNDVDHFAADYFGKGVRWNLPDLDQSEIAYRMARYAYDADGRRIIDATRGGALRVFDKLAFEDALAVAMRNEG